MVRDEAGKRADFSEHSDLVDLLNDSIENFSLERSENDGFVLNRIHDKTLSSLNYASSNIVDRSHRNDKSVLSSARSFYFCVKLLTHCIEKLRSKVSRMK